MSWSDKENNIVVCFKYAEDQRTLRWNIHEKYEGNQPYSNDKYTYDTRTGS